MPRRASETVHARHSVVSTAKSREPPPLRPTLACLFILLAAGAAQAQPAAPPVTVSPPLQRQVTEYNEFTGQFAGTEVVEIRPRVGGYLTEQLFTDGQIVTKGAPLFTIDPRPYEIALQKAQAQATTAEAQLDLATRDVSRGSALRSQDFLAASVQDQRVQAMKTATASLSAARAEIRSAQLDLEFSHITAPVTGRIGTHQVSLGNLVNGGASIASPTLLTTIVAFDPIWFNFDMSETDYLAYQRAVAQHQLPSARDGGGLTADVQLGDEHDWKRHGHIDFLDNQVDRSSGTIRVRASFANPDQFLTPGQFGRLRLPVSALAHGAAAAGRRHHHGPVAQAGHDRVGRRSRGAEGSSRSAPSSTGCG